MPGSNFRRFYDAFREIISIVHSTPDTEELMNIVVWKISETVGAKGAIFRLLNTETDELELSAAYGIGRNYLKKGPRLNPNIITDLCRQNRAIIIDDILNSDRLQYAREAEQEGIRCIIDVPLTIGIQALGILRIYFAEVRAFSDDELNFMVAIAEQCSCALSKARIIEEHELKYNQLALQTDKLSSLGRLAAGIAHEINNPLAGILLYSSNLAKKTEEGSQIRDGLDIIIHETIRCRKIIQELLDFSREREPQKDPYIINDIVEKSLAILENEFLLNRVDVEKNLAQDLPLIMVDGNQLEQVFVNLLINCVEALDNGGRIEITSSKNDDDGLVTVEFSDNGPGIPEQQIDKIFDPFYSTKSTGTGLGLSVSYGIIRKHGGQILVENGSDGGARFKVEIPYRNLDN